MDPVQVFPKPLNEMSIEELSEEIERIRSARRNFVVQNRKKKSLKADPTSNVVRGISKEGKEDLLSKLLAMKKLQSEGKD